MSTRFKPGTGLAFLLIIFCVLASCSMNDDDEKTVVIQNVGWTVQNIDRTFFSPNGNATCYISFDIKYEDNCGLSASDIASVRITMPGSGSNYWLIEGAEEIESCFDAERQLFLSGFCYSTGFSANGSLLPIGTYTIETTLVNENADSFERFVPAPGALTADSDSYAYSEDYLDIKPAPGSRYNALPVRASDVGAAYDTIDQTLMVEFGIDDELVYSGNVLLYDSSGSYIGRAAAQFRNYSSGEISPALNDGVDFYTDGTQNVLVLSASDANLVSGAALSDVSTICVQLTDGKQYIGTANTWDTGSISVRTDVVDVP